MLMLVTGASGAGKTTVRKVVAPVLAPAVVCIELGHVVTMPAWPTKEWRQQATETVVRLALELQRDGHHLLLSGDPVAAGEVVAAPSADALNGIAVCLLDVSAEEQAARLGARGDDPSLLRDHQAFARWMRGHARDPLHDLHVLTIDGWEAMRWDRLSNPSLGWSVEVIDTTDRPCEDVAADVIAWSARLLDQSQDPPPNFMSQFA